MKFEKSNRFLVWNEANDQQEQPEKLTDYNEEQAARHISPVDYTKELLTNESKDRRLYKYAKFYEPKDFHDRYLKLALFLWLLSYILSGVSSFLSFPFLDQYLSNDVTSQTSRFYAVVFLLALVEVVKHTALATAFKTHFTYRQKPVISSTFLIVAIVFSVYACINGVFTSQEIAYKPPTVETITTQYDNQEQELRANNEQIFKRANWKGKLNSSSTDGKAYAANEQLITNLTTKAAAERETKLNAAVTKYDAKHIHKTQFRSYAGYLVEFGILFSNGFFLLFMFTSSFEHLARIRTKFMEQGQVMTNNIKDILTATEPTAKNPVIGFQNNSNKKDNSNSNKEITNYSYQDLTELIKVKKQRINAYKWKLKNKQGRKENNLQKIAQFEKEVQRLQAAQSQLRNKD